MRLLCLCLISALLPASALLAAPRISITKSCDPDAFVNDTFNSIVTITNTGDTPLTNTFVLDSSGATLILPPAYLDTLPAGDSFTWSVPSSSSTDGAFTSTATAFGDDGDVTVTASASCSTQIWSLRVSKTANTSYTRDWNWSLTKTPVQPARTTINRGAVATVSFIVAARATSVDGGWKVSGLVTVHNPAPIPATLAGVTDALANSTPVPVQCGGSAPYTIAAGGDLLCSYSAGVGSAASGTNTATATLANNNGGTTSFDGSASYTFGAPTTVLHATATVTDSGVTIDAAGWSLSTTPVTAMYAAPNGGSFAYNATVGNTSAVCNTNANVSNTARLTDGDHTITASAVAPLFSGTSCGGPNCTLSSGFWKTHAGFNGHNPDLVTRELPQWLGTAGGAKSVFVGTASSAFGYLSNSGEASNGINKLYAQMLAAKLNIAHGASPAAISSTLTAADAFLAANNSSAWQTLSKSTKSQVEQWRSRFGDYNEGEIGPGECED